MRGVGGQNGNYIVFANKPVLFCRATVHNTQL